MVTNDDGFKKCNHCGEVWPSLETFLASPQITFIGYQAFVRDGVLGLFLFNHSVCSTTLAIRADRFRQIEPEPIRAEPMERSPMCLTQGEHECPVACECGWTNRVIDTIQSWPKAG